MPRVRLDLNGYRLRMPHRQTVYLVDQGRRRKVPNRSTYESLFRDWEGIVEDIDIIDIAEGPPISSGARLVRHHPRTDDVFLIDQGKKRKIASPAKMEQYHFRYPAQPRRRDLRHPLDFDNMTLPKVVLDAIPDGPRF